MALEGIVKDLWDRTDAITKPDADFEAVRAQIRAASESIRANYTLPAGTLEGQVIVDKVQEFSSLYLNAAGIKFDTGDENRKKELSHQYMKRILGRNYSAFVSAIKTSDIDNALFLAKNAFVNDNYAAQQESVIERLSLLSPAEKTAWATHAAEQIEGNNPLAVLENLPGYFQTLREMRGLRQPYITPVPALAR